jgi:hypothetical protein
MLYQKMQPNAYRMNNVIHELYLEITQKHTTTCVDRITTQCKIWQQPSLINVWSNPQIHL